MQRRRAAARRAAPVAAARGRAGIRLSTGALCLALASCIVAAGQALTRASPRGAAGYGRRRLSLVPVGDEPSTSLALGRACSCCAGVGVGGVGVGVGGAASLILATGTLDGFGAIPRVLTDSDGGAGGEGRRNEEQVKDAMIEAVKFYKRSISPLLPPACRFLPTCSSYSIEAIQEFGPAKGFVLTAWRLMRCNPLGGSGYDPPRWPPPSFRAGSTTGRF